MKTKCTRGFLYTSISFQAGFFDHTTAGIGSPGEEAGARVGPGFLIVLANFFIRVVENGGNGNYN